MNYVAAQEHVPRAERNNRVIQERFRAVYHRFPYSRLLCTLVKYLVMESTKKLNFFPNKYRVSRVYSPRMIMLHENLDFERHCKYQIGEFVQAHEEPHHTNTNASGALDSILLRRMENAQGGHELLHLQTNKIVKRSKLTKVPITPSIIKQVHVLAELDDTPRGLKITNRANQVIFHSAWIAGVDYDEESFDDDIDDDYDEEDNADENINEIDQNDQYDEMDENDMADIQQQPNDVPQENYHEECWNFVQECTTTMSSSKESIEFCM
jgi:hypothetical protein